MSSTHTDCQLCTATPILLFAQCKTLIWLLPWTVSKCVLIEIFLGESDECSRMTDTYGIHHWRILWSSYRKLAWVEFEPTTTEFRSDAISDWAIWPWVRLALRANYLELLQFHCLFSLKFHFGYCLRQLQRLFWLKFSWGNHMSVSESMIHMVFTTDGFFKVAIESWPEWDLNPRPLNSL